LNFKTGDLICGCYRAIKSSYFPQKDDVLKVVQAINEEIKQ